MMAGRFCPYCEAERGVHPVKGDEPFTDDHFQCRVCDSTYTEPELKRRRMQRLREQRAAEGRCQQCGRDCGDSRLCEDCRAATNMVSTHAKRKYRYGVTREQYAAMLADCQGCCLICDEEPTRPHIDHDHETGRVRGLLCPRCNILVGFVENSESLLPRVKEYLDSANKVLQGESS
jgi:hypothetical protein